MTAGIPAAGGGTGAAAETAAGQLA
jgi:hypothetical protein